MGSHKSKREGNQDTPKGDPRGQTEEKIEDSRSKCDGANRSDGAKSGPARLVWTDDKGSSVGTDVDWEANRDLDDANEAIEEEEDESGWHSQERD